MKRIFLNIVIITGSILLAFTQLYADLRSKPGVVHLSTEDLKSWTFRGPSFMSKWTVGDVAVDPKNEEQLIATHSENDLAVLINTRKGFADIMTQQLFGDCVLELEVMIPKHSNSGIYLMGRYEVQVKDSYGKGRNLKEDDMGAVFNTSKPLVNAARKAGEWQNFLIEFRAPRFENGERIKPAEFVRVILNGEVVQRDVKMVDGPTKGAFDEQEAPAGPIMLQGGIGPVAYRNITITIK